MAAPRRSVELVMNEEEMALLGGVARSCTPPAGRHHQTMQRCVERAVARSVVAALDDLPRPGKAPSITSDAMAWLVALAYEKAK